MSTLDKIKIPIAREMADFEHFFKKSMHSKAPLLNLITNYILRQKGKQMRPIFVFLSAKLFNNINQSTYHAAGLIELLHTATLVHDDVVDESYQRRGFFSINALWKNKIAVLIGDYLLARGLELAVNNNELQLLKIVSDAVKEMAEGELIQIEKSRRLNTDELLYFEIIRKKTATLLASCTSAGAKSAGATDDQVEQMRQFGENIGIAFQIKDDLFDFEIINKTGKPSGNDIQEKKLTLPLIYAMNNASPSEKRLVKKAINKNPGNYENIMLAINFAKENGGIEYAKKKMMEYRDKSIEIVQQFGDNDARQSLIQLVNYTIERDK